MDSSSTLQLLAAGLALVFPALVITGALKDATSYTIPNWISVGLVGAFPIAALAAGLPAGMILQHFGLGALGLALGMAMFALRWVGGGDAKLLAASALWVGWTAAPQYLAVTGLCGGALALMLISLRSDALRPLVLMGPGWFVRLAEPGGDIPYGLAIAAGALAAFPLSPFGAVLQL
jgi:prepilin peptidase CpaA